LAIILIGTISNKVEGKTEEKPEHEKKPAPVKEVKPMFHEHFHVATKDHKKKSELLFPTIISFFIAIAVFFLLPVHALAAMMLIALVVGFIVFVIFTGSLRHRFTKGFRRLWGTKLYILLLIGSMAFTAVDYYTVYHNYSASIQDYIAQNLFGEERIPTDGYVFTGQGTVLSSGDDLLASGTVDTATWSDVATDIFSGMIKEETGTVLSTSETTTTEQTTTTTAPITIGKQKLMDAIVYVVRKYDLPLVTRRDVSFTYVTSKNPYYNEWRTAYANNLIGKSTNPSKYMVCDSYIVMKWLVEKWNVQYTASNVLTKFWAEAVKRNALNGCVKGKIVTDKML